MLHPTLTHRTGPRLSISPDGQLGITVTRGKAITQQWVRVGS
ncbi:MAG TPA: hypothetical protein VM925_33135 [Labilithrix sp.]|nr:hypothetical protein [Labilithrix sp.]